MSSAYISTKYLGPTNTRGSRIKATCQRGSVTIPFKYNVYEEQNHYDAVKALVEKFGLQWGNDWAVGSNDDGYVFVPVGTSNTITL